MCACSAGRYADSAALCAMQVRGFRGERWWTWVALLVLSATIVLCNAATILFNHIMPRAPPSPHAPCSRTWDENRSCFSVSVLG